MLRNRLIVPVVILLLTALGGYQWSQYNEATRYQYGGYKVSPFDVSAVFPGWVQDYMIAAKSNSSENVDDAIQNTTYGNSNSESGFGIKHDRLRNDNNVGAKSNIPNTSINGSIQDTPRGSSGSNDSSRDGKSVDAIRMDKSKAALFEGTSEKKLPNVLMLIADDMRPDIGAFLDPKTRPWLHPGIKTPNLDALAERSIVLRRAFVQVARCGPSRSSVLTGRRPNTTHVVNNDQWFRKLGNGHSIFTIPQYFKQNGYVTIGFGKVFHLLAIPLSQDQTLSWSGPFFQPRGHYDRLVESSWKAVNKYETKRRQLRDQITTFTVKRSLRFHAVQSERLGKPFFMAVGFKKPHIPYVFPSEFLNLYPLDSITYPANDFVPDGMTPMHWHNSRNTLSFSDTEKFKRSWKINSTLPRDVAIQLRRAYYASVSYVDSLIGEILAEIDALHLRENTIVVFFSDHGYQLGEHGIWGKDTNLEMATNTPMMLSIPGLTDKRIDSYKLTEFVDLFPTLVDAAGLPPLPTCPSNSEEVPACTEGSSLMPLLRNASTQWKDRVFSQYPHPDSGDPVYMGYSMRTEKYLYVEWVKCDEEKPDSWPNPKHVELYDISKDIYQNKNVAGYKEYENVIKTLAEQLHAGWRAALPIK